MKERAGILGAYAEVGRIPHLTSLQLHARMAEGALRDAELGLGDIDGLVTIGSHSDQYSMHAVALAEYLGIRHLKYADVVAVGGASAVAAVNRVSLLAAAGVCRYSVIVSADSLLSGMTRDLAIQAMFRNRHPQYEGPYGPTTAAAYAMLAHRYLYEHGLDEEYLAYATLQSRFFARVHGKGIQPEGQTLEEILASRLIASPLRLYHCAPIADGGGAVVVGLRDANGRQPTVRIIGAAEQHENAHLVYNSDLVRSGSAIAARTAIADAAIQISDLDVALVYDAFASSLGMLLEDLGLAEPGRAFHMFRDGEFSVDGRLPVNPHGGLLSGGHPGYSGGMLNIVEAVHQIQGRADIQIPNASQALVHGSGGILSTHAVAILEGVQ